MSYDVRYKTSVLEEKFKPVFNSLLKQFEEEEWTYSEIIKFAERLTAIANPSERIAFKIKNSIAYSEGVCQNID